MLYERRISVPRLQASVALGACPPASLSAPAPYTRVGLNLYRDGRDSVAPHGDRENELQAGQPIALLSLGATRVMVVRERTGRRRAWRLPLESGSLLVI